MIAKMGSRMVFVLVIAALFAASPGAWAGGGIYFDDFRITNNGNTVFSDSFDDGYVGDWTNQKDAGLSPNAYSSPASMHLNWHGGSVAQAFHYISITQPGIVEVSARVWLPPVAEQYHYNHNVTSFTGLVLYSGNGSDNLFGDIRLRPGDAGYGLYLGWNPTGQKINTSVPVLSPGTWALLSLRMDGGTSTASLYLDGIQRLTIPVSAQSFTSYTRTSMWGWLGNGTVPEPSGLLSLGGAIPMLGLLLRRRR